MAVYHRLSDQHFFLSCVFNVVFLKYSVDIPKTKSSTTIS